ncbi:GNAT family N-acetyltransferase [Glycomyces xiaoerkulensis]|uniref:GNAT family N-acetyltransferase n=1 Tax=Glycomyces xiaoerkulensis TaxID=2038139 RepID=UPI0012FFD657|nr:GNAT family N-acetyltransferase [Glycomyces xiaoerkulensis]
MIDPAARGQGLGAKLPALVREDYGTVWPRTRPDCYAPGSYRRLGWERAAEVPAIGYDLYVHRKALSRAGPGGRLSTSAIRSSTGPANP